MSETAGRSGVVCARRRESPPTPAISDTAVLRTHRKAILLRHMRARHAESMPCHVHSACTLSTTIRRRAPPYRRGSGKELTRSQSTQISPFFPRAQRWQTACYDNDREALIDMNSTSHANAQRAAYGCDPCVSQRRRFGTNGRAARCPDSPTGQQRAWFTARHSRRRRRFALRRLHRRHGDPAND